jgi:hypothetical protein
LTSIHSFLIVHLHLASGPVSGLCLTPSSVYTLLTLLSDPLYTTGVDTQHTLATSLLYPLLRFVCLPVEFDMQPRDH